MASSINSTSTGSGGLISTGDDSGILNIQTNETTAVTVDASQNVGIGTASPTGKLDIVGTGANILMNRTSFAPKITMQKDSTEVSSIQGISGGGQLFTYGSSTTEAMRIDSSGNLVAGTTSQVAGGIISCYQASASGNGFGAKVNTNSQNNFIGQNSSSSNTFYVNGTGQIWSIYTSISAISDRRLKTNINTIKYGLDAVLALKPVGYDFVENDLVDGASDNLGFIAQDVKEVIPELVAESLNKAEDGSPYLTLKMGDMLPILVKAIQELKAINDTQAETINALTARIVALEGQ
jgi:hypothetical protein